MGFYGNITNTSRTQFQFDKTYPSRFKMTELCPKDGIYIGRYVLVDYDADPNNVIKDGYRKGKLADFKDGSFLYQSPDLNENFKITYFEDDYWDYDWNTTDVINGVLEGTIVRVLETVDQYKEYNEFGDGVGNPEVYAGSYSFYECTGYISGERELLNPETGQLEITPVRIAQFKRATVFSSNYTQNYNEDKNAYGKEKIGRGWDSTVWQKVYENGEEKYVMIAELNSVVPTFDVQADAPSMSPLTPHFDEGSTNVYYKLHWQPQWGLRTRAADGELKTLQIDKNGVHINTKDPIYTSTSVDLKKQAETYPSDVNTYWEKYEYDTEEGNQVKYQYNILDQRWDKEINPENKEKYEIPAAIFFNKDGFNDEKINHTETTRKEEVKNKEWDGKTDFISIKPTGWSGHQYSAHDGFKELKAAPDTQELMIMLPSVGNVISNVWDIVYGGLDTNPNIKATGKRNKVIEWENPDEQLHRKGLRLIEDNYTPISLDQIEVVGWKANTYYIKNKNEEYELIADESLPDEAENLQFYVRSGGHTYNRNQVNTLAGCINSVHDLMGMIIIDEKLDAVPENAVVDDKSSDYIYYYPIDGTYRVKDFSYIFNNLDENEYYTYELVEVSEEDFLYYMYYTKDDNGNYIPLPENAIYSANTEYYARKLNLNKSELFEEIQLGTFTNGYFLASNGSYIWKDGGTPDNNVTYYDIYKDKITDNAWPMEFEHVYEKNKYFYQNLDKDLNKNVYLLMQDELCERSKRPFRAIPHEANCAENHPYTVHITDPANRYDYSKMDKPEDAEAALTWKGPFRSEGYWSDKDQLWLENEYVYPTYFFTQDTYYQVYNGDETGDASLNGISYKKIITMPDNGYAYILDRPRANTSMPDEEPVYGNPIGYYKVKLIDYNNLTEEIKSHLYYAEQEEYEEEVEKVDGDGNPILDESGNPIKETVKKTRFIKWIPVTAKDINDFYYHIGCRAGGVDSVEEDNLKPKKIIYYISPGEEIDYFYEPNRYFYLGTDGFSYIKDKNPKFTKGTKYYDSAKFTIHKSDADYETDVSGEIIKDDEGKAISKCAVVPQGDTGHYYLPNKYYFFNGETGEYELDTSQEAREGVAYYERNDIYVSNDDSNTFAKGSSWNLNALIIPNTVTLGKREEQAYMKELKGFGRDYNTINGLIVQLNRMIAADNYDTRDRSTLQGAINYLNDMIANFDSLTPGDIPIIDDYGRLHGGEVLGDKWVNIDINRNVEKPTLTITHKYNPVPRNNTSEDVNGKGDTFTYPTYTFDETGHQVGNAEHTVTLPYSFKTIKATNTEDDAINGPAIEIKEEGQIADNTQDTLTFSASNRWIKFDNNTEDTVKVGHLLSPFIDETVPNKLYGLTQNEDHTKAVNDLGDLDKDNTFEVPCFQFDEAGHILEARTHTVTLPEIYNKFIVSAETAEVANMDYVAGTIAADNMNDTVTFTPGNKWIHMAVSGTSDENTLDTDVIKIAHEVTAFDDGEANKEYGLLADETISDVNNSFEIPAFKFDEAGHIRGARTHILTLPFGFTKFTKSAHVTTEDADKTEGSGQIVIEPDTMTDNLSFGNGNKWICIDGNAENDTFTFSHYVKDFTEGTSTTDLNNSGTFTVQELSWDRAGHLIGSNKRTYTLPYNFKTFTVSNNDGKDNVDSATAADGSLIAGNQIDEMTFASGNRWMTLIADVDSKKVTLAHAKAGATSISKGDTESQTPKFGSTFKVLSAGIDQTGHVSSLEEHTVQIPLPSLNNETNGGVDSVLTKLTLEPIDGAFTAEHKNVGELLITGYSVATENSAVSATDSINSAFGKVQKALDTLNADSETAGSVAKSVKDLKDELQDSCSERFNTLAKIESDINDGSETTLVERVQDLEKRALPHYNDLEDEGMYIMKMIDGQPNWIKLATWTGGTY